MPCLPVSWHLFAPNKGQGAHCVAEECGDCEGTHVRCKRICIIFTYVNSTDLRLRSHVLDIWGQILRNLARSWGRWVWNRWRNQRRSLICVKVFAICHEVLSGNIAVFSTRVRVWERAFGVARAAQRATNCSDVPQKILAPFPKSCHFVGRASCFSQPPSVCTRISLCPVLNATVTI